MGVTLKNYVSPRYINNSINSYINEVKNYKSLDSEKEIYLIREAKKGSIEARNQLCQSHLLFVVSVANILKNNIEELSDLINEGNLGLIKAIDYFDETKGFRFLSFAITFIKNKMLAYKAENGRTVRLPNHHISGIGKLSNAVDHFIKKNGYIPSDIEIGWMIEENEKLMEITDEMLNNFYSGNELSIDKENSNGRTIQEVNSSFHLNGEFYDDLLAGESFKNDLKKFMDKSLTERDKFIVCSRFGLFGAEELPNIFIAGRVGMTVQGVQLVQRRFLNNIKKTPFFKEYIIY